MTAKRSHPRIPILLRLEPEELAAVDMAKLNMARTDFIRSAIKFHCQRLYPHTDFAAWGAMDR